jgi:hypothetical protein
VLTLLELKELLKENEMLMAEAMRSKALDSTQRLFELTLHRSMIKDMMIELMESELQVRMTRAA